MPQVALYNQQGAQVGEITLNETIFGIEPHKQAMFDAVIMQRASMRQGTHKTKTRTEVRGGGRKPWKQKGTGRARQGSIRATQWRGGGIAGGVTPRDYTFDINKKERALALKSALTHKAQDKELVVIDNIKLESLKTKEIKNLVKNLELNGKVLFVTAEDNEDLYMATRNLGYAYYITSNEINCLDLVNTDILVCDEAAVKKIEEVLK